MFRKRRLPTDTRIVGFSRTAFTHDAWRGELAKAVAQFVGNEFDPSLWDEFAAAHLLSAGRHRPRRRFRQRCAKFLDEIEKSASSTRVYYLATAPQFYEPAVEQLGRAGLADENGGRAA